VTTRASSVFSVIKEKLRLVAWVIASSIAITVVLVHVWPSAATQPPETFALTAESIEPIQPIKPLTGLNPKKIELGRKLFHDPALSRNNQVACATCHNLKTGGADHRARSIGANEAVGVDKRADSSHAVFNFSQFWDGRAPSLEQQIDGPLRLAIEMNSSWIEVIRKLSHSPQYVQAFRGIYPGDIQIAYVKDAIAEFERSLSTPNSRFDRYLRHASNALTADELHGYLLFKSLGCTSCHQGANVGGNMYQKLGVMTPYFTDLRRIGQADRGRFNVTGDPKDLYMFKVPSIRNVELTPPYLHDGSAATLPYAVRVMAKYQLGRDVTDRQVQLIVEFLRMLTGEFDRTSS
jgi:cytochrome c peroxidase